MNKRILVLAALFILGAVCMTACTERQGKSGAYDFVIYESDRDNSDLSDNTVVARYHISYDENCKSVSDTLIKKDTAYYFDEKSEDFIIMENGPFGLTYTEGYFAGYADCKDGRTTDISWSYTAVNGAMATAGISETSLDGLNEYGFVINGWKTE